MAVSPSCIQIDYARDENLTDFALQTLKERYMMPGEKSPQEAFARSSAAFADDEAHAQRLYDYVSRLWFMFATPLLANGGTERGLPISCFLLTVEDSRQAIFDHWAEVGWLASLGGGVGSYWGDLRSDGEATSKRLCVYRTYPIHRGRRSSHLISLSQGNTRRGSEAVLYRYRSSRDRRIHHHPQIDRR
jgi:ribonucleoside-diphosphate reductase alpha chain